MKQLTILGGWICCMIPILAAQPVITTEDITGWKGTSYFMLEQTRFTADTPITSGEPGANQIWDFTDLELNPNQSTVRLIKNEFIEPDGTPFADDFENATLLHLGTITTFNTLRLPKSSVSDTTSLTSSYLHYSYYELETDALINVGDITLFTFGTPSDSTLFPDIGGIDTLTQINDTFLTLPLTYQNSWVSKRIDTLDFLRIPSLSTDTTIILQQTVTHEVDGWGTLILPAGQFECLRVKRLVERMLPSTEVVPELTVSIDTIQSIDYLWINRDYFTLARLVVDPGESDISFPRIETFSYLTFDTTFTLTHTQELTEEVEAVTVYPNPSTSSFQISFHLQKANEVKIDAFDIHGQRVALIHTGLHQVGRHTIEWDISTANSQRLATGLYWIRLQIGKLKTWKKVVWKEK